VSRRWALALAGIALVAFAIRVAGAMAFLPDQPGGDSFYFHYQANLIADGHWFQNPFRWVLQHQLEDSSIHPPLYVLYLAAGSALGLRTYLDHAVLSCVLGSGAVVVVGLLARRVAGPRAGLLAAALAAIYPNLWLHDTIVMSESLYILLIALVLLAGVAVWERPTRHRNLLLGGAVGLAALTRGEALTFLPLLVAPALLRHRRPRSGGDAAAEPTPLGSGGWVGLALTLVAAAAVILPWSVWNSARFGQPVLVSINSEEVLAAANCPATYAGERLGYWSLECFVGDLAGNEAQRGSERREQGVEFIRAHLGHVPAVMAARVGGAVGLFRPFRHVHFGALEGRDASWGRVGFWAYWALIPIALHGALVLRRRRAPLWPILAPLAMVLAVTALVYGSIRFRLAAEVPLLVLAAVAMDCWLPGRPSVDDGFPGATAAPR
jgi:4-amino-4-deoxy-L-arabinose transferase-like glycosyltransferase